LIGFAQIFAALEAADPGNPANLPMAQALSTIECSAMFPPPGCNPLLANQQFQVLPPFVDFPNSVEDGKSDDSDTTWTARIAFDLSDDVNLYASASTGFNLSNAGEETRFGFEFDGTFYPNENWLLTLAATWLDPEYVSFVGALGPTGPTDLSGETPAGVHELSLVTSATYTTEFDNGMEGFFRVEYLHESDVQVVDNVPKSVASREVGLLNASVGLSTESGWDFMLWGRNLTDDEYLLSAFPSVFQLGSLSGYPNAPTTYGLTIRKDF